MSYATRRFCKSARPGAVVFGLLLLFAIALKSSSIWTLMALLVWNHGALPIILGLAFIGVAIWQCSRAWISGVSVLAAPLCVFLLGAFPHPINSPIGWAANVVRIARFRGDLARSYLEAKNSGDALPVGQVYLDGFGSLTSGLAYDPSQEIAAPIRKRTDAWMSGPGKTELGVDNLDVHHVLGSYYYWFHD